MRPAVTTDKKKITEKIAFIHHAITEQSHTPHNTARLITAAIVEAIRTFVFVFICQSSEFNWYCSINARTSRLAFFIPSIWADTYGLSNSFVGRGLFAHISKFSISCFAFISFIFFVCFKKKAARVGYGSIISSLSLRLASVPLWLLNPVRCNRTLPVVHSNYILNILLVRVGRRTYVRTIYINLR